MDKNYYLQLRNKYLPDELRYIFVLESPPVSGKYFYDEACKTSEPLFTEMMRLIGCRPRSKRSGLKHFRQAGYFLVDATYQPVNNLKGKKRDEIIMEDFSSLVDDLRNIDDTQSIPIILVKANVCKLLEVPLKKEGFNVINDGVVIPFPSTGQQKRFHREIGRIHNAEIACNNSRLIKYLVLLGVVVLVIGLFVYFRSY
jgi:hypothetical protein